MVGFITKCRLLILSLFLRNAKNPFDMTQLQPLMDQLGIQFSNPSLLELALTHRSYINEHPDLSADNERLEFLGDAVLDFVVGAYLYTTYPDMQEGEMTALRAALVRAETLADFATQLTIDEHLRLGQGEQDSGGRRKKPTLCAAFEAVIGAAYLDQGLEALTKLIERLCEPALEHIQAESLHKDSKANFRCGRRPTTPSHRATKSFRLAAPTMRKFLPLR